MPPAQEPYSKGTGKDPRDGHGTGGHHSSAYQRWILPALELSLIALWVLYLGQEYLVLSPRIVPTGPQFLSSVHSHHIWNDYEACGGCAFWSGYQAGGHPAFADPFASALHPIVIITTRLLGVIDGAKIALLVALFLAGFGQWWTARILELGWLPRIWSALLLVAGGHLAGRMEAGIFGAVLSSSMAGLVFPATLGLAIRGGRRYVASLGLTVGSALLAGHGYMQFGLLMTLPAISFLVIDRDLQLRPQWKDFALGGLIGILVAAPFLVPLAHFLPNLGTGWDLEFSASQPLAYLPLNLVIDDPQFLGTSHLGMDSSPYLHSLFIGWVPVILAVLGLGLHRRADRKWVFYLTAVVVVEFLLASGVLLRWGQPLIPALASVRKPAQLAGLAVPPVVTLAAYGLDRSLRRGWPPIQFRNRRLPGGRLAVFSPAWLLIIPLALNLRAAANYARVWLASEWTRESTHQLLRALETESLQWVQPPFGLHFYLEPAISMGMKLSPGIKPWNWRGRETPRPVLEANGTRRPTEAIEEIEEVAGIPIYRLDVPPYAYVDHGDGLTPCRAEGRGGELTVECRSDREGELIVQENTWSGWRASVDGEAVPLTDDRQLSVEAPAGVHTYRFRYQPWDVPLGLTLALLGLGLSVFLWFGKAAGSGLSAVDLEGSPGPER